MAEKIWVGNGTDTSFHEPSNWQDGTVPNAGDTAVFDGTASGNCTLQQDMTLYSWIIHPQYGGTFHANGKKITISGGRLCLLKGTDSSIIVDGILDFTGSEFAAYLVNMKNTCDLVIRSNTNCQWWYKRLDTSSIFKTILQENNAILTLRGGLFPDTEVNFDLTYCFMATIKQEWHGKIIATKDCAAWDPQMRGDVIFGPTAEIDASLRDITWYVPGTSATVTVTSGCRTLGNVNFSPRYSSTLNLNPGDFRPFRPVIDSLVGNSTILLKSGVVQINEFVVKMGTAAGSIVFSQAADSVLECYGDLVFSLNANQALTLPNRITWSGTADQTTSLAMAVNTPHHIFNKQAGRVLGLHNVTLAGDSVLPDFLPEDYTGVFRQNGYDMTIIGEKLHIVDLPDERYELNGQIAFHGDLVVRNSILKNVMFIAESTSATARFLSGDGKYQLGGLKVNSDASLTMLDSPHDEISGSPASHLLIQESLSIRGALRYGGRNALRLSMKNPNGVLIAGNLIAWGDSMILVEPGNTPFQPYGLQISGDVRFVWNESATAPVFLPGNYSAITQVVLDQQADTICFLSGNYLFSKISIITGDGNTLVFTSDSSSDVDISGTIAVTGRGECESRIRHFRISDFTVAIPLDFLENTMETECLRITSDGRLSGAGELVVSGNPFVQLDADACLAVDRLRVVDASKIFELPRSGWQSLVLEAKSRESVLVMSGKYEIEDFTMLAVTGNSLTVDVRNEIGIMLSGDCTVVGDVYWLSDGDERIILVGDNDQLLDMPFVHGHHVLNRLMDAKTGGETTIVQPLDVWRYTDLEGNPCSPLTNMRILFDVIMKFTVMLTSDRIDGCLVGVDETKLDQGKVAKFGSATFYAKISDQNDEPIDLGLIKSVRMEVFKMNHVAPDLHPPRQVIIAERDVPVDEILSSQWRTSTSLLGGHSFNLRQATDETEDIRFTSVGLYHVIYKVQMYGKRNAIPLRFALVCES